jgi:Carboxypeptidase regulatory-like domain
MLRAGVIAMVAAGAVVGAVTPAFADITSLTADPVGDFRPGDSHQLKVHADGSGKGTVEVNGLTNDFDISLTSASPAGCTNSSSTSCSFTFLQPTNHKDLTFTITAHQTVSVAAGQSATVRLSITGADNPSTVSFRLFGATATQAPNTVAQVTGTVKDTDTGQPVAGAVVGLQDSASPPHTYSYTTDAQGRYVFRGTSANPIAPGIIAVDAVKDGYKSATKNATVQAGQSFNFSPISLQSTATPTPGPSATDPGTAASTGTDTSGAAAAPATNDVAKNSGSGFSTLLIVLGAVLVLLGIGAIVFILIRRRREDGEGPDEFDETGAPQHSPTPVPASRGMYRGGADPTAVVRNGGYGDPTTVGGMSDAPTMMHSRPPVDEYRDPYGAPTQPAYGGGYDDRRGGYDDRAGGQGHGVPSHGGQGQGGYDDRRAGGYDDRRGGYDDRHGYDERGGYDYRGGDQGYDGGGQTRRNPPPPDSRRQLDWLDD